MWICSILAVIACFALGWTSSQRVRQSVRFTPVHVKAHVQWASQAGTVAQQVEEADAVVRGHVTKILKPHIMEGPLGDQTDHRFPSKFDVLVFTEALFKVDKVFRGDVPELINVIQTGGTVPENANHPTLQVEVGDDPLLVRGREYVLFLQEINDDSVLAPHRKVYRIVNSAGRYDINGDKVVSYSDLPGKRPTRFADLRQQIRATR